MPKSKDTNIDGDPMFDTSDEAINRAHNRRLSLFFQRVERLEEEKKCIADDIRGVWTEMKAVGYDSKLAKAAYKLYKMNPDDRLEYDAIIDAYRAELGI